MTQLTVDMKIAPGKILHDLAFANILQHGYQIVHASMV